MGIKEEVLDFVKDNVHAGDILLQRARLAINDEGTNADPRQMQEHLDCAIAHLKQAADDLLPRE